MANGIVTGRPHRASGDLGLHVLEIMESFLKSSDVGRRVELKSKVRQPEPVTPGLELGKL